MVWRYRLLSQLARQRQPRQRLVALEGLRRGLEPVAQEQEFPERRSASSWVWWRLAQLVAYADLAIVAAQNQHPVAAALRVNLHARFKEWEFHSELVRYSDRNKPGGNMRNWIIFFGILSPAFGQMSGPVLGLVREAETWRPLRGAPGSLALGDHLVVPDGATAELAPRQQWLLLKRDSGWAAWNWRTGLEAPLPDGVPSLYAFSPAGKELAMYSRGSRRLIVVSGLPNEAMVERDEVRQDLDDAAVLATNGLDVVARIGDGRLMLIPQRAAAVSLYNSDELGSIAFVGGGRKLLVADHVGNAVLLIDLSAGQDPTTLLSAEMGLDIPDEVWAGEGGRIAVVSKKRQVLWTFDPASASWAAENIPNLAAAQETQLRDGLMLLRADGSALGFYGWVNSEQRLFPLPTTARPQEAQ